MSDAVARTILALDVGQRRIGLAVAQLASLLPEPRGALEQSAEVFITIRQLLVKESAVAVVVGLPRGLDGQETAQTRLVREFVDKLKDHLDVAVYLQDEALTSNMATQELEDRGVRYNKGDVDALAATYILRDFLQEHPEFHV